MKLAASKNKKPRIAKAHSKVEFESKSESVESGTSENKQAFTDLHQVMDYTRPLTIMFSGVEYESYLDILYELGIRNFLMSYEYLKGKGNFVLKKYPDVHIFIDSGAYTYQTDPKFESYTVEQWEKQIEEYLKWAERHKDQIFAIANLDLQYLPSVGYDKVHEWNQKYFEPFMLRTGVPVCFVYHEDGLDYWDFMCKRYPYVAFSAAIDKQTGDSQLRELFRIAEKHNALVQGMATTDTHILVDFPFYTVDSTTWNVGLKFGEISVWDKTRMKRIKKDEFETKAFPVIAQYKVKFDFDLIREEDKTEMIRVNAYAFVEAQKYVNERLKARMYWLKAKAVKNDLHDASIYPPADLIVNGKDSEILEYAKKMNINPEAEEAVDIVTVATAILNRSNPQYRDLYNAMSADSQAIASVHDKFVNRIVEDDETKLNDLYQFFAECVSGENDTLLQLGTNFDRVLKERDNYVEDDDEYDLADISADEVRTKLHALLPAPEDGSAPEIESLDEEIFAKADIVPVFDPATGKLLKGQQKIHRPKQVYSNKYPKYACDTCYAAQRCPQFKAGYVCAFQKMFKRFDTRNQTDIISSIQGIVEHNMTRMQRAMIMETMNGTIDPVVSQLMDTNIRYMDMLNRLYENSSAAVLQQTRVVKADGSVEEHTSLSANPQSGGIMEMLLSKMMASPSKEEGETNEESVTDVENHAEKQKNERYVVDPEEL